MRTSVFSTKDVALMGLLVGVVFTICLYLCSLYVSNNHIRISEDLSSTTTSIVKTIKQIYPFWALGFYTSALFKRYFIVISFH